MAQYFGDDRPCQSGCVTGRSALDFILNARDKMASTKACISQANSLKQGKIKTVK
jgi:hypothetical protein